MKKKNVSNTTKKKKNIKLPSWMLYIHTSVNNTIVTLTDDKGNKVLGGWTGLMWYKWTKESTPYAAEVLAKDVLRTAKESYGLKEIWVEFKGVWLARDWVFKAINELGWIDILFIREKTPIQFWGCKGVRPRRN